jgi:hypothetical protein
MHSCSCVICVCVLHACVMTVLDGSSFTCPLLCRQQVGFCVSKDQSFNTADKATCNSLPIVQSCSCRESSITVLQHALSVAAYVCLQTLKSRPYPRDIDNSSHLLIAQTGCDSLLIVQS